MHYIKGFYHVIRPSFLMSGISYHFVHGKGVRGDRIVQICVSEKSWSLGFGDLLSVVPHFVHGKSRMLSHLIVSYLRTITCYLILLHLILPYTPP